MATVSPNPVPFSEPPYLRGLPSPYYSQSHRDFQSKCRAFVFENLLSRAMDFEKQGEVPTEVFDKFNEHNMLLPNLPAPLPVDWLKRLGVNDILGISLLHSEATG